ncbi:MAG: c-type cytochrome [Dehalococcoidia bacterium]|nr:c-type cytochrome [Dehalococcoidia bacterium]
MSRHIGHNPIIALAAGVILLATACGGGNSVAPTRDPALPPHIADVANGERLFKNESCSACHAIDDRRVTGPGLAGIGAVAATRDPALNADEYLERAIRNPGEYIVDGFSNVMPNTYGRLPQDDVDDLIAYLKTLE